MNIAIIGGGAAGFFAAINIKKRNPDINVRIYERSSKVLSKVKVSGGGRCNLTNSFEGVRSLQQVYPRGHRLIKRAFKVFDYKDAYQWFETEGVRLTTQSDNCVFPYSQDSQEIIDCFLALSRKYRINIHCRHKVESIIKADDKFSISFSEKDSVEVDRVIITTGGHPKMEGFDMLKSLPVEVVAPVPSLFSMNVVNSNITELTGVVMKEVTASIQGTKLKESGDLLITHWGFSGPAILKLSSHGARVLSDKGYKVNLTINWIGISSEQEVMVQLDKIITEHGKKLVSNITPFGLISRFWDYILAKAGVSSDRRWAELGRKSLIRIVNLLIADDYAIDGRAVFREEFVTCGGVALSSIDMNTLEAKECKGLYFAGEVLDIDAVTGGFNLQAAWSCGYMLALNCCE